MCEKVHVTATAESPTARGSPRTGVQPWGGQRKSHDSRWQGRGLDTGVFNCLAVISEIFLGDTVARVMKKINTQHPIYPGVLKCSTYLLNIHSRWKIKSRLRLSCFTSIPSIIFCSSVIWGVRSFNYIKSKVSNRLRIWNDAFFVLPFFTVQACSWKAQKNLNGKFALEV